ncbi:hypothetical protein C8F01DRAFT_1105265 [Mycena amicta]|nr:hypothetical protein C8F01DRAFT_1105265 [Mycena amicta]
MSQQEWEQKRFDGHRRALQSLGRAFDARSQGGVLYAAEQKQATWQGAPNWRDFQIEWSVHVWPSPRRRLISRLNHSCAPNVGLGFDKASFSYEVHALRDIPAGEELFMSYIHISELLLPKENRNTILRRRLNFGGPCLCSSCTQSMEVLSDRRRAAIEECNPTELFERWQKDHTLAANWLLQPCYNQLGRIQREGLQRILAYSTVLRVLMEACICLGDAQNASIWARRLYDAPTAPWQGIAEHMATVGLLRDPDDPAYQEHDLWCARL